MQDDNWDDLRFVLAVGHLATFAATAKFLDVNESTVARRIARYQRRLGTRLFERHLGVLQPTAAGEKLILRAERVNLEIQAAEGLLAGINDKAAGSVRITTVPLIANHVLIGELPKLLNQHPALEVELVADWRNLSLTKREADIALRFARPAGDTRAIVRRVGQMTYATYCAASVADTSLQWITYDGQMSDLPQAKWIANEMNRDGSTRSQLQVNDAETLLKAVKAGLGKSLLPVCVGGRDTSLVRLGQGDETLLREIWLMVHPELRDFMRIRVVMDWLTATMKPISTMI